MSSTHLSTERIIEKFIFANRKLILFILTIIFAFLATEAIQVKPEASFSKMVPGDHEFINNYTDDQLAVRKNISFSPLFGLNMNLKKGVSMNIRHNVSKSVQDEANGLNVRNEKSWTASCNYSHRGGFTIPLPMMDDWHNDTCAGKYLKTIYERRIEKKDNTKEPDGVGGYTKSYGGQIHFDIFGIENTRKIIGMDGFAGQQILIDLDNKRIIVVSSLYRNYNWKKIVYSVIKN